MTHVHAIHIQKSKFWVFCSFYGQEEMCKVYESSYLVCLKINTAVSLLCLSYRNYSFKDVNITGVSMIARIAKEMGVKRLIHFSHLNAQPNPPPIVLKNGSEYLRSKVSFRWFNGSFFGGGGGVWGWREEGLFLLPFGSARAWLEPETMYLLYMSISSVTILLAHHLLLKPAIRDYTNLRSLLAWQRGFMYNSYLMCKSI